jgi:hypothetical protein
LWTAPLTKTWFHLRPPSTAVLSTHGTQIAFRFPAMRNRDHCGSGGPSYRVVPSLTTFKLHVESSAKQRRRQPCTVLNWADLAAMYRAGFAKGHVVEIHALFFLAAIVAGAINALAGGGGLITFPLLALVVPPVTADATSALALLPAYPAAVWRTRDELSELPRRWLWLLLVPSELGGLVGALPRIRFHKFIQNSSPLGFMRSTGPSSQVKIVGSVLI